MTTYDWHTTYRNAVETFGGSTPGAALEQTLIDLFAHSPQTVINAIDKAGDAYNTGRITSPWGIVRTELSRITDQPHLTVVDSTERERRIAHAEQWIRAAGLHFDDPSEVTDELFGERGMLRTYAQIDYVENQTDDGWHYTEPRGDTALVTRMLDLWANHRPTGMQIERDATTRAEAWKAWKQLQTAAANKPPS